MTEVRAKKFLGQHFLTDENIAQRIVSNLSSTSHHVLEIGPGMGVLTKYLLVRPDTELYVIEIDHESVEYLNRNFPSLKVIEGDFLKHDISSLFHDTFAVIGNFPYNISSQILFRVLDLRDSVTEVVGMFQKEVAERIAAKPGSKVYGILSVLLSAYYDIEYLFTVGENVFNPPPKVKSAVVRLKRNNIKRLDCDEVLFIQVVKVGFNQRRKTLRNALRQLNLSLDGIDPSLLSQRAEQLTVEQFISITKTLQTC